MMFGFGFICGAAFTGAIAAAVLIRDMHDRETTHTRYVREWQRANYNWRHPRAKRHRRYPAPLPLDLGGWQ